MSDYKVIYTGYSDNISSAFDINNNENIINCIVYNKYTNKISFYTSDVSFSFLNKITVNTLDFIYYDFLNIIKNNNLKNIIDNCYKEKPFKGNNQNFLYIYDDKNKQILNLYNYLKFKGIIDFSLEDFLTLIDEDKFFVIFRESFVLSETISGLFSSDNESLCLFFSIRIKYDLFLNNIFLDNIDINLVLQVLLYRENIYYNLINFLSLFNSLFLNFKSLCCYVNQYNTRVYYIVSAKKKMGQEYLLLKNKIDIIENNVFLMPIISNKSEVFAFLPQDDKIKFISQSNVICFKNN